MSVNLEQKAFIYLTGMETQNLWAQQIRLSGLSGSHIDFWQLWQQYRDYHYSRCLQWMGGNSDDAEESLSQAMFKAWNKWPDYGDKITNPKAWLTRIIYNHCMDIHRQRKREAQKIENIDDLKFAEDLAVTSNRESLESEIFRREMRAYLHHAIEALPAKLRNPFILRYLQRKSYKHIAKQLALAEENVWKRVQQARSILRNRLNKYLAGEDDTCLNSLPPPLKSVIPTAEESKTEETVIFDWEPFITTGSIVKQINYQLTVTCLETLPHNWYSSPSPLGWS